MSLAPPKFAATAWGRVPEPLRRRCQSSGARRLFRFAPAAVLALAATQITYFLCVTVAHTTGRISGFAGWLAGAVVSYAVSRWAWERRGRPNLLRETLPFVAISLVVGAILTEASHFAYREAGVLGLRGLKFVVFVQGLYLIANGVTFILRFFLFNYLVFADRKAPSVS